jgi:hydrogenase maturation protein HypF
VWGGELLLGDLRGFERVGHLLPVRLPGGAQAIRQPWRMAAAWLLAARAGGDEAEPAIPPALARHVAPPAWSQVLGLSRSGLASPVTTSVGRLFDAVAALCGLRATINYEGQAAIELEAECDPHERGTYPFELAGGVIDPRAAIQAIVADLAAGATTATVAARFHAGLARATVQACARAAAGAGTGTVVVSGGVFANRRLLELLTAGLRAAGLRVLAPQRLPAGDGGISYGQAAIDAARTTT